MTRELPERHVVLNELAQGLRPLAQGIDWFDGLPGEEQRLALRDLAAFAVQARATTEDGVAAVRPAGLKPTHTPSVLLSGGRIEHRLGAVARLEPPHERRKAFRLLVHVLARADARRRERFCRDGCSHAWHRLGPARPPGAASGTTDWSRLTHAYGTAEDVPVRLARLAADPTPQGWDALWSALCPDDTVHPAGFAALPGLLDIAGGLDQQRTLPALALAGAIVAGADQPHGAGDVRARYATEIAALRALAEEHRRTAPCVRDYAASLDAQLSLEGGPAWAGELTLGIIVQQYELTCPACAAEVLVVVGDRGRYSRPGGRALATAGADAGSAGHAATHPLRPADPADLRGTARRLYDLAVADHRPAVAAVLACAFGTATCPGCGADFPVAERIAAAAGEPGTAPA
ncbi:DUF5958 family protein [Kitasatospora sp. NPDC051705]|uniref:DUF5958 family protein n=1 Tax=Kitasatospora sp. NPDC051705 TaxID=3364057 RepID=UPI0037BD21F5